MEFMADWENLVKAEKVATKRKKNYGVHLHQKNRWQNLIDIQEGILNGTTQTTEYTFMTRVSGQGKVRNIAKLKFHPNHIQQQVAVLAAEDRIEKRLIHHSYASRVGFGQLRGAQQMHKWLKKYPGVWYAQGDICKFFDHVPHEGIHKELKRCFKDKRYIEYYMEPIRKYSPNGVAIPLGIKPSQQSANLVLSPFDHYILEEVRPLAYERYLDDFVILGNTRGEVKRYMRLAEKYLKKDGFDIHVPKIHCITKQPLDFLGWVFHDGGSMFWRKSNKKKYLRRRSKVTNLRRLGELDAAAKGMLKWGNKHCKRLYKMTTGVSMDDLGVQNTEQVDKNGTPIIDLPVTRLGYCEGQTIRVFRWVEGAKTKYGDDRVVMAIRREGVSIDEKVISNSFSVKQTLSTLEENGVTQFSAKVVHARVGSEFDRSSIIIEKMNGRDIFKDESGQILYADTRTPVEKMSKE
jgi:hypothetical protein